MKYYYDGTSSVSNDPSLTLFRRIWGPTCSIYKQEDTKDVFMFLYAGLGGGNGEWTISNEVSARDIFVCTIHIPPLNDYPNQKLPTLKYTNSWDVFPCKEIEGIAIVNDPATDCSNETIETFKRKVGEDNLFMSTTKVQDQMICRFQHFKDLKTELNRDSSLILLGDHSSNE